MKIFFTTPFEGKKQYQRNIDEILHVLESVGVTVISPEKDEQYRRAFTKEKLDKYGDKGRAHYAFIRQGIASADALVFEASYEDFRVGHEATLGLMYGKPELVLSKNIDYSRYITHEKFFAKQYRDVLELKSIIFEFLKQVENSSQKESFQEVTDVVDLQHSSTLSKLRLRASQGKTEIARWARRAAKNPDLVYEEILSQLGNLPIQNAWDVFARVYNEDTPDRVFYGAAKFADKIFSKYKISQKDRIVDAACGTAAVSRLMTSLGYTKIRAFDRSRAMLAEAYRLCAHLSNIEINEAAIEDVEIDIPPKGIVWFDFSTNFSLTEKELKKRITRLITILKHKGIVIMDVRTATGWNVDFFHQKVTIYETDRFQRIWVNLPNYENGTITFDIFIRIKGKDNNWLPWEREQMTERMWKLNEVEAILQKVSGCTIEGIFRDDFTSYRSSEPEPGLAYIVIRKK